ncbi:hypothetical protein MJO29_009185 [Puccinia striiformis f. sp. tritici]|nr:hypothetical protein Pst134EB_018886 [Puccinia striiformis f. sp. tritici]KAI7950511.1 hypothetical protein MJO29_009185 [Puccinia striiformis f. sp. tritici]KAI9616055.1 hypothetical protein H4Q26_011307 [Puccinia striiformis f. sp. tritici PST-130]
MSQAPRSQRSRARSIYSQAPSQSTHRSTNSKKHRTCPRCGSRKWRRDPNRGVVVCGEGHVLEGFLRESTEQTEASQYAVRKRRLSAAPKQRKFYVAKAAYQDQRARVLLVQGLTLLIRKQIEALIKIINAPPQLEEVARTLWQAYVSVLNLDDSLFTPDVPSSPVIPSSRSGDDSQSSSDPDIPHITPRQARHNPASDSQGGVSARSKTHLTPEALKAITQEHSESSDQSSDDSSSSSAASSSDDSQGPSQQNDKPRRSRRSRHRAHAENIHLHPRMVVTICTVYLACLKLRLPIVLQDLINFITTKQVPYIGFIHSIPVEVQQKMNRPVMQSLSAEKSPRLFSRRGHSHGLVYICRQLLNIFQDANPSVLLPENTTPNLALLVLRFSKNFLLPDPLQLLALHLVRKLDQYFLTLNPLTRKASSTSLKTTELRGRPMAGNKSLSVFRIQMIKYPPEWFVMAVVFIVARSAIVASASDDSTSSDYEPSSDEDEKEPDRMFQLVMKTMPDLDQWYDDLTQKIKLDEDKNPQTLWEKNLTELNSKEIDSYIGFAQDFLLKDQPEPNDMSFKNQFFPLLSSSRLNLNEDSTGRERGNEEDTEAGQMTDDNTQQRDPRPEDQPTNRGGNTGKNKQETRDQATVQKLLTQLLLTRGSEIIGCSIANHSHLEEFVKVYDFMNSFLTKKM